MHTPHVPRADDGPTMRPPGRNTGRAGPLTFPWIWPAALAVILLVALAVRFGLVLEGRELVQSLSQVLDARYYVEAARAIASGEGLPPKPFFMSPGYIGFVALFARAFGDPIIPLIITQILIDGVTCLLTSVLAASLFGRPAGFLAGLLLALHGPMILASSRVLPETLVVFFLVLLALALTHLDKRAARGTSAVAGLLLGLICLLRSNAILFLPILLTSLALRGRGGGRRAALTSSAAVLAGFLAVILPVTLFNAIVGRDFVLISTNGGVNFYIGNATEGDGRMMSLNSLPLAPGQFQDNPAGGLFEQSVHDFAERKIGRLLRPSEASAFWWRQGMVEIERSPTLWAKLVLRKAFLLVNGFEVPQVENIYFTERYLSLPRGSLSFTSRLLWPLALAGSVLLIRRRRISRDLLLLSAAYAVSLLIFFVTWRHRLPLLPLMACFAAFAAVRCVELARLRSMRPLLRTLALLALTGIVCNLSPALGRTDYQGGFFDVPEDYLDFASQHNNLATVLLERGKPDAAEAEARRGLEIDPKIPALWFNLACALAARGALSEASEATERSLALNPKEPVALTLLGEIRYEQRDFMGARKVLERAMQINPSHARAWGTFGITLSALGDTSGSLVALREAIRLDPGWLDPRYNLSFLLERLGHHDEALAEAQRLLKINSTQDARDLVKWLEGAPAAGRRGGDL
jgi:tetratricopeptide (TPR) repeat protein